jgi:hypothetical protein
MIKKSLVSFAFGFLFISLSAAATHIVPADRSGSGDGSAATPAPAPGASTRGISHATPRVRHGNPGHVRRERVAPRAGYQNAHPAATVARPVTVTRTRIIRQQPVHSVAVPSGHAAIVHNNAIIRNIQHDRRVEIVPNHAYWHNNGGVRYVHTYRGGIHWYGFYHGSNFYWTRYHRNRWWWYDPSFNHWVFWANGYWWWNGPDNVLYVYENDSYYPYDVAPVQVAAPAPVESQSVDTETENNGVTWTSSDGRRMIQIQGPQSEAYLYDKSGTQPKYLAYLGSQVERVRFSGGTDGRPLKILVDFKNGNFSLFSGEGEPLDMTPPDTPSDASDAGTPSMPPTPPTDIPN